MEEKRMGKINLEESLYYAFFILLSVAKGLGFYVGQKIFLLFMIPAFVCVLAKIFLSSYTKRQWIMQALCLFLTALVYYESRETGIFFIMFMILGMKNISVEKVFRIGLWTWSVCSVLLSVFSFFRLEDTIYRVHSKMGMGHIFRWSLGFTHPNILHITYLALCAFFVYELAERYTVKHFILMMIGNVLVFFFSISYTGFGIVAILLVGELYVKIRPRFAWPEKIIVQIILPVILFVSFILPIILYTPWVQKLNFLLNTRLYLARQFLVPEYMSLFGVKMADVIQSSMNMDNSYIWGFINYGIIPFALFMLAYLILIADYTKKQKTRELVMIICFWGAGFTEQLLFNTSFKNITLLFLGELLFRQKAGAKEYCIVPALRENMERIYEKLAAGLFGGNLAVRAGELRRRVCEIRKCKRRQIVLSVIICAVVGAVLCGIFRTEPKGYIVPRFYTDGLHETSLYLTGADDALYEGYRIMNYIDADTPMQMINGKAVTLESARYYTGSILIGGLAGCLVCIGYFLLKNKRLERLS